MSISLLGKRSVTKLSDKIINRIFLQEAVLKCMNYPLAKGGRTLARQTYDYFLILDFEATCDKPNTPRPQEIIEFPVLKVNGRTFETEAVFHQYVQPRIHKELTSFCIELTGIVQDMVDDKPYLEEVLEKFANWRKNQNLDQQGTTSIFVTCGDWDLNVMLPSQCDYFGMEIPHYMKSWINIKKSFAQSCNFWPKGLTSMMNHLNLNHEGRLHSGIDDCKNIAQVLKALAKRDYTFSVTSQRP